MERKTGKIWWNTKTSLVRENRAMLTLPLEGDSCIYRFNVEADHFIVSTRFVPAIVAEDGHKFYNALAVYHRKSGARLLQC